MNSSTHVAVVVVKVLYTNPTNNTQNEIVWIGNNIAITRTNCWQQCHKNSNSNSSSGYPTKTRWSKE